MHKIKSPFLSLPCFISVLVLFYWGKKQGVEGTVTSICLKYKIIKPTLSAKLMTKGICEGSVNDVLTVKNKYIRIYKSIDKSS